MKTIRISTDVLPERERIAFWHDLVCRQEMYVTPTWETGTDGFRGRAEIHLAGRFVLSDVETSHGSIEKTSSDLARGASDSALVYLNLASDHAYRVGADAYDMVPGDICIVPMDRRFHGKAGDIAFRSLLVPHAVLGPLMAGRELTRTQHLKAGTPLGTMLTASLNAAAAQVSYLDEAMADAVLANLSGLVALAVGTSDEGAEAGRDAVREARLHLIKRHVDQHLAQPLLNPATVAAALRISVRQLHLLFQPTGETFAQYLLRRRLDACRATLASPAAAGRSVADIAFAWGFNSLSVFYRAFAAAFGAAPSDMRATALQQTRQKSP